MRRLAPIAFLLVVAAAGLLFLPGSPQPDPELPGPDPRPAEWWMQQRLYPYGDADADAYPKAIEAALQLNRQAKTAAFGVWEFAGPTNVGGRIVDIEFDPQNPDIAYAGAATGGVFKSTDAGLSWFPIFDDQAVLSIGDIAVDPNNSDILYVGTGEANGGHNNFPGGGMFKSTDAGATWRYIGLASVVSIGRVLVDPQNSDRLFVAGVGSYFKRNPERGVYRSLDGGDTWEQVHFVSDLVGAIDLIQNPDNPDDLMAAMWERERTVDTAALSGPGSGVYRSLDGGDTWAKIGSGTGLPGGSHGRIGLALHEEMPNVRLALFTDGQRITGVYRTVDSGLSWSNVTGTTPNLSSGFSWYFGQIRAHPTDTLQVYVMDVIMARSASTVGTYQETGLNLHVDHHALAFQPGNPDLILNGNDGGIGRSTDGGRTWTTVRGLPITQFYEIAFDPSNPERLYGGTQDNGTVRTATGNLDDWDRINGGDGFYVIVDPRDPGVIYAESQNGGLTKITPEGRQNALSGISTSEPRNWSTPVVMDPNNPDVLYFGTDRLYRTTNGAASWTPISPKLPARSVSSPRLGTLTTIAVAPSNSDVLWAGTDDGTVWTSRDGGGTWTRVDAGLPVRWVTRIAVDPTDDEVAYVTFSGLKFRDPQPHVFRTRNGGERWSDISGNLPDAPINAIAIDPVNTDRVFIGSDVGVFFTDDAGDRWQPVGSGLPAAPVADLKIEPTTYTLIAGTHGRSMYRIPLDGVITNTTTDTPADAGFTLAVPYPNPTTNTATLRFTLDEPETVRLEAYDATGRRVQLLAQGGHAAGSHELRFDATNLPAGTYLLRLQAGDQAVTQRLIVL